VSDPRRVRLVLEYDGTEFCGFQRQPDRSSVQAALEGRLAEVLGHPVEVVGAGRTDAGVHALGQVIHFDTTGRIPTERIAAAVNSWPCTAITARHAEETAADFHARFGARERSYEYYVDRDRPTPALARYVVHDPHLRADAAERMREALQPLLGTHDFATFCAAGASPGSSVRTVLRVGVEESGGLLRLQVTANAFLKSMVRIIAGTVLEVGRGRREPDALRLALEAKDRAAAAMTAPAHGLFLTSVDYPDGFPGEALPRRVPFWFGGVG
jgi:tRNA pseudouridine38-40 synthase